MAKRKQRRSVKDYRETAKKHADLFPALSKYKNRRKLNRGEKAVISKAAKQAESYERSGLRAAPLSESDADKLRDKGALLGSPGGGVPAARGIPNLPGGDVSIDDDGDIHIQRGEQEWFLEPIDFSQDGASIRDQLIDAIERIRGDVGAGPVQIALWQTHGTTDPSGVFDASEDEDFIDEMVEEVEAYENAHNFMFGISVSTV